jgi:stage II sporulation protein D
VLKHRGEEAYTQYFSEVSYTFKEIEEKMKEKYSKFSFEEDKKIEIKDYTESGRVKTIQIGNISIAGVEARSILELKSANFVFEINGDTVTFKVTGYGHGVRNESNWSRLSGKTGV